MMHRIKADLYGEAEAEALYILIPKSLISFSETNKYVLGMFFIRFSEFFSVGNLFTEHELPNLFM